MATKPKTVAADAALVWTQRMEDVLAAIFEGRLTHEKIAENFHVSSRTLRAWIAHPDFKAKLAELRANLEATLSERGVAYVTKEARIMGLSQMAASAREEYEARPLLQEKRQIGFKKNEDGAFEAMYLINEAFNADAHSAFRDAIGDIAKELGHRQTKVEHSGNPDAPLVVWTVPQKPR